MSSFGPPSWLVSSRAEVVESLFDVTHVLVKSVCAATLPVVVDGDGGTWTARSLGRTRGPQSDHKHAAGSGYSPVSAWHFLLSCFRSWFLGERGWVYVVSELERQHLLMIDDGLPSHSPTFLSVRLSVCLSLSLYLSTYLSVYLSLATRGAFSLLVVPLILLLPNAVPQLPIHPVRARVP